MRISAPDWPSMEMRPNEAEAGAGAAIGSGDGAMRLAAA